MTLPTHRALELGINWIDTAAVYGLGHSEELVGRLLRELPSRDWPLVFTKCGLVWDERDRIDLYQFHRPDETGVASRVTGRR